MQIGRMHLFIGVLMAIFQGSLVRRIAPGKENKFALIVSFQESCALQS